jgi:hypothetical protein
LLLSFQPLLIHKNRFLPVALLACLFSLAVLAQKDVPAFLFYAPLCILAGVGGYASPTFFLKSFFLLLPLVGFMNLVGVLPAMPVLLPVFYAGVVGWCAQRHSEKTAVPLVVFIKGIGLTF